MSKVYTIQVRDLLNPASNVKGGLKVREHPSRGFYGMVTCDTSSSYIHTYSFIVSTTSYTEFTFTLLYS